MFDIVYRSRHRPLRHGDDPLLHFIGRNAGERPNYADDWYIDVGKNIVGLTKAASVPMTAINTDMRRCAVRTPLLHGSEVLTGP